MQYKTIDIIQGSQPWLDFRKDKIGASDYPTIIGKSPYQKHADLLMSKLGFGKAISTYQQKLFDDGHEWEAKIRDAHFKEFQPIVIYREDHDRLFCSLDGFVNNTILEIKSTRSDKILDDVKRGVLPEHFEAQIDFQLFISGAKSATLCVVDVRTGEPFVIENITQSKDIDLAACYSFLAELDSGIVPVQHLAQNETLEYIARSKAVVKEYQALIDAEEEKIKQMAEGLLAIHEAEKIEGAGVRVEWAERKGNIDYGKIEALKGVDLEKYRKKSSRFIKISLVETNKQQQIEMKGNDDHE